MNYRYEDQQHRQELLTIVDRGTAEQLFTFLQKFHRRPFQNLTDVITYTGVIDDQIDFIDCAGTKYNVTPLIIAAGKGSYEKTKILLVHGANPNKQCATGDTALNLAVHRQKYPIVDLLLQYNANPNVYNQSGKTALHRAVVSYTNENASHIRTLLTAGADPHIEDRNQRTPLDEAVVASRPESIDILLSHDRTLVQRAYRAAIMAARLGHDKCLEKLLNHGMDPNITDRTNTTALHVAVRSLKLSTVRLLIEHGADHNRSNNRGETALSIAELLQADQQQNFINALIHSPQITSSDYRRYTAGDSISYIYPLLRNHSNWTLDSDDFRSSTAQDSSVQNLLDMSSGTYWCSTQSNNVWIIFDLKHLCLITGIRIIGCDNQSTPKNGHLDVSNTANGPWLKVTDFTCLLSQENKNDFFFSPLKTRFIRVFILDNYGSKDIRIQGIGFFGVDMRLINLLREYDLENSLNTLLANGINDQETLNENRDEILNSSDKYLHVNDHFKFIRLTESLKLPQLTFLEWFSPPQTTAIAGEKLQTFSIAADEEVTDRIKLEEKLENSLQATTVLIRDLEPIQGHSLVDFSDYIIKYPGRYKIRIVSFEYPDIHTPWHEIVVGSISSYSSKLNTESDEQLYLLPTTHFYNVTTSDKENTLRSSNVSTSLTTKDNRAFITKVYESENDDTEDDTYLTSLKSIEDSPYYFSLTKMSRAIVDRPPTYSQNKIHEDTQMDPVDYYDRSTNTGKHHDDDENSLSRSNFNSTQFKVILPSQHPRTQRSSTSNNFSTGNINKEKRSNIDETLGHKEYSIMPTKYKILEARIKQLRDDQNKSNSQRQHPSQYDRRSQLQKQDESDEENLQPTQRPEEKPSQDRGQWTQDHSVSQGQSSRPHRPDPSHEQNLQQKQPTQRPEEKPSQDRGQWTQDHSVSQGQSSRPHRRDPLHEEDFQQKQDFDEKPLQDRDQRVQDRSASQGQSSHPHRSDPSHGSSPERHLPRKSSKLDQDSSSLPDYYKQVRASSKSQYESDKQQQQRSTENIGQDHVRPFIGQYKIISGNLELRKTPVDNSSLNYESKSTQMELLFKGTVEDSEGQEPRKSSLYNSTDNRTRYPSSSNINDQKNLTKAPGRNSSQPPTNAYNRGDQHNAHKIPTHDKDDESSPSRDSTLPRPSQSVRPPITPLKPEPNRYPTTSNDSDNEQPSKYLAPSNMTSTHTDEYEGKNYDQTKRYSHKQQSSGYDKDHIQDTDRKHGFKLDEPPSSPPRASERATKYFFGESSKNPVSDEEDDETQCETFGHDSQSRPIVNTDTRRSLDYVSTTNPRFSATKDNNYSDNPQFEQQRDVGTTTGNRSTPQQRYLSSTDQSTVERNGYSQRESQTFKYNNQTSVQNDYAIPENDPATDRYNNRYQKFDEDVDDDNRRNYHDDDQDRDDIDPNDRYDHDYQNGDVNYDDNIIGDDQSTNAYMPRQQGINALVTQNPIDDMSSNVRPAQYPYNNYTQQSEPSISNQSYKTSGKKPLEITIRTTEGPRLYTPGIIPLRPHSTPTSDTSDEIIEREPFDKIYNFDRTPNPYRRDFRNNNQLDDEDSDSMTEVQEHNRERLLFRRRPKSPVSMNRSTQSKEISTRNIGTMSDPVEMSHFGNETQPQSSATQTSDLQQRPQSQYGPKKQDKTYSKQTPSSRPHSLDIDGNYISPSPAHQFRTPSRSPSPRESRCHPPPQSRTPTTPTKTYLLSHTNGRRIPSSPPQSYRLHPQRSHSFSSSKRDIPSSTNLHDRFSPPDEHRSTPLKAQHHTSSSLSPNRPHKQMISAQTDTSQDAIEKQRNQSVQPDPLPTRDFGVTTSPEAKHPYQSIHSQTQSPSSTLQKSRDYPLTPMYSGYYRSIRSNLSPSTSTNYILRPTQNDVHANNYEEIPVKHDEEKFVKDNRTFGRSQLYPGKPTVDIHQRQRSFTIEPRLYDKKQEVHSNLQDEVSTGDYISELPSDKSIPYPQPTVIKPETLPRSYEPHKSPINKKPDYFPIPLYHGQEQRTSIISDSPVLNIGTENIIRHSPDDEFAIPFETRYIHEPNRDFTTNDNKISPTLKRSDSRFRNNQVLLLPVLNSSRTYIFEKQTFSNRNFRQSEINGNFYLATSPVLRSSNSSFQVDESEIGPLTQVIDSNNSNAYSLRSQVA